MNPTVKARADIDWQYLPSLRTGNPEPYLRASAQRSARVRRKLECDLFIPYGKGEREYLDIFPSASPDAPVFIFLHGGYWYVEVVNTQLYSYIAGPFVRAGATVVLVEYELCPTVRVGDIVDNIRRAMVWVYKNIKRYNGNARDLYVSGHSAGGHLTAMLAATDWREYGRIPRSIIKGIAPLSGLFDIEPHRHSSLQPTIRLSRRETRKLSPMFLPPTFSGSALVAVGENESDAFHWQSLAYAAHLRQYEITAEYLSTSGDHHFSITDRLGRANDSLTRRMLAQMGL
ncbi:MAG: alpha/beta hydrolase [Pseudomonadota bacterium]